MNQQLAQSGFLQLPICSYKFVQLTLFSRLMFDRTATSFSNCKSFFLLVPFCLRKFATEEGCELVGSWDFEHCHQG